MRRRNFTTCIEERFHKAWIVLPIKVRNDLSRFIRYIEGVSEFETEVNVYVCPLKRGLVETYGTYNFQNSEGLTVYIKIENRECCDIFLNCKLLENWPEDYSVGVILHELAHAYDFFSRHNEALNDDEETSENIAWQRVIEWLKLSGQLSVELAIVIKRYGSSVFDGITLGK